jgi:hypothetical protein
MTALSSTEVDEEDDLRPRCYVSFSIVDSPLDLKTISKILNQESAITHRAGDRISPARTPSKEDVWTISSPLSHLDPLQDHLQWIHEQLEPHTSYLAELSRTGFLRVYIGFTFSQVQNNFRIPAAFIRFLGSINALIDMFILQDSGGDLPET